MSLSSKLATRSPFYYGWIVLAAAGTSQIARNAAATLTMSVFMFPLARELGWSRTLISGAASVGGLASSGASPVVGWLIDKYGARTVMSIGILVLGLAIISLSWATTPIWFYLAFGASRVIFASPIQLGSSVVVSRWFIRMRGRANGVLTLSHSVGMVGFPLLATLFIAITDWQTAWILLGLLVWIIAFVPVCLLIRERPEDLGLTADGDDLELGLNIDESSSLLASQKEEPIWSVAQATSTSVLWILAISVGALYVMQAGTNIHMGAYLRDLGFTSATAGVAIGLNAAFTGVGGISWGWISEKVPVKFSLAGVAVTMSLAVYLMSTIGERYEALLYASLFGFGLGGMLSVPPVAFADYFGRQSLGSIRGIAEPFSALGQAIGALISGLIFDWQKSYMLAFWSFGALGIVTAVILISFSSPPKKILSDAR